MITRTFQLRNGKVQMALIGLIPHLPISEDDPLEVVIRKPTKKRNNDQNNLMWAALADISEQAFIEGRQFSADIWHHYMKQEYLPEQPEDGITSDGYVKWDYSPSRERVLVGSTTQLTTKGFSEYMEQLFAHGASLGVMFKV